MSAIRMDNVSIVVTDLDATIAFFEAIGMELEGRSDIQGAWAGRVVGLENMHSEIAMMRMPGGHGRLELATYHSPPLIAAGPAIPNVVGFHRVMFAVDDIRDTVQRLEALGGELVGAIENFEDVFLLCYFRGPDGIVVGLAEQIG